MPAAERISWPSAVAGTPTAAVLDQAISANRLPHSILLHGDDVDTLVGIARAIADRLLNPSGGKSGVAPDQHPDFFALRPKGKMRIIPIGKSDSPEPGTMRDFLPKLYVSPSVGARKVAVIYEADRMNQESANALLKTLEEPPASTTMLLLTTRPYALLPTIRSRVLQFRFPSAPTAAVLASSPVAPAWASWIADYSSLLGRVSEGSPDKRAIADHILTVYGLVARFQAVLDAAVDEVWKQQKETLPPDIEEDEQVAIETGIANGMRSRLFADIERATREFALPKIKADDETVRRAAIAAVENLEHTTGLLRLNLNEAAALETFLLASLRTWTKR